MILYRYLAKSILVPTTAITVVALMLFSTSRFVGILERAVANGVGAEIVWVLLLNYPKYLIEILPVGFYLGVILGIGKLYAENEITALVSSGVPQSKLIKAVLVPSFAVCLILWLLTLWLAPLSTAKGDALWREISQNTAFDLIEPGEFIPLDKNNRVIFVETETNKTLQNIFLADPKNNTYIWANAAELIDSENNSPRYFTFYEGIQLTLLDDNSPTTTRFGSYGIKISNPEASQRAKPAHSKTNKELLEVGSRWDRTELLYRILYPPFALVLGILGLAYSYTKPRQGRFRAIIPAILTYALYSLAISASIRPVYREQAPFWSGIWWVHLLFLFLSIAILIWPTLKFRRSAK